MSLAVGKESFFWHKVHSLTGIVPVGFYMVQHLTLNSFSLAGPAEYNSVSAFFYGMPHHLLLGIEALFIWIPLLFHAVYGLFISGRAVGNYYTTPYRWAQNRMFTWQRTTGIFLFLFLIYHVITTTIKVKFNANDPSVVNYAAMQATLSSMGYLILAVYALGVLAASYHFSYGIWNFCIRWGITVSPRAQERVERFAFLAFVAITLLGWAALYGFFKYPVGGSISA